MCIRDSTKEVLKQLPTVVVGGFCLQDKTPREVQQLEEQLGGLWLPQCRRADVRKRLVNSLFNAIMGEARTLQGGHAFQIPLNDWAHHRLCRRAPSRTDAQIEFIAHWIREVAPELTRPSHPTDPPSTQAQPSKEDLHKDAQRLLETLGKVKGIIGLRKSQQGVSMDYAHVSSEGHRLLLFYVQESGIRAYKHFPPMLLRPHQVSYQERLTEMSLRSNQVAMPQGRVPDLPCPPAPEEEPGGGLQAMD